MKRRVGLILMLLVAGAILNVAVAWVAAFVSDLDHGPFVRMRGADAEAVWKRHFTQGAEFEAVSYDGTIAEVRGRTFTTLWARMLEQYDFIVVAYFGWPARCLGGELRIGVNSYIPDVYIDALQAPSRPPPDDLEHRFFPLRPLWPGFAINTVFYAAILWLLFALGGTPFALRRRRRIKRGLCPACAYPVGASDVCAECGKAVIKRKADTHEA